MVMALLALFVGAAVAQGEPAPQTLFTNVHVFDGVNDSLEKNTNVLIEGNLIKSVGRNLALCTLALS